MKNIFSLKAKKKILIIDDEEDIVTSLKSILERTGKFEVFATTSPMEGLDIARAKQPDMALLDLLMPEMSGTEVADLLAKDPPTKDCIVVFVSALAEQQDVDKNTGVIGGHQFISKPVEKEELIARIEAIFAEAVKTGKKSP